jgi:hypothetical protein
MREAARIHEQLRQFDLHDHIYTIQDALEEQRRIERELRTPDAVRRLQEAAELFRMSGAVQLDLQSAAQEALDHQERLRETVGDMTLAAAAVVAEQRIQAVLDTNRVAGLAKQLDAEHLARTLERAQELLADVAVGDLLAQADAQAIIRDAEEAMDAYPPSRSGEFAGAPPEWLRRLSREKLVSLVEILELYVESLLAIYFVVSIFTEADSTEQEVEAVLAVLKVALRWARHLLEKGGDGD